MSKIDEGKYFAITLVPTDLSVATMILEIALLERHSKEQTQKISDWVTAGDERMAQLMYFFANDSGKLSQRAAWVMSTVAEVAPNLVQPYLPQLLDKLKESNIHDAIKRHVLRAAQYLEIETALHEPVLHHCFEYLSNPKEALAIRAFALITVARLASHYPELKHELKIIIEDAMLHEPAASFKSKAAKVLKQL